MNHVGTLRSGNIAHSLGISSNESLEGNTTVSNDVRTPGLMRHSAVKRKEARHKSFFKKCVHRIENKGDPL